MNKIVTCGECGIEYYSETIVPRESFRHVYPDIVKVETELAEARVEIERLNELIEQMRDALKACAEFIHYYDQEYNIGDGKELEQAIAALEAAERNE